MDAGGFGSGACLGADVDLERTLIAECGFRIADFEPRMTRMRTMVERLFNHCSTIVKRLLKKNRELIMSKVQTSNGIGFGGILGLIFITLKLTEVIDWSWWWVLSPLWIPIGVVLIVYVIALAALLVVKTFEFIDKITGFDNE